MSYGTIIKEVLLRDVVPEKLVDNQFITEGTIANIENEIRMLVASDPTKLYVKKEDGTIVDFVSTLNYELDQLLEDYKRAVIENYLTNVALADQGNIKKYN